MQEHAYQTGKRNGPRDRYEKLFRSLHEGFAHYRGIYRNERLHDLLVVDINPVGAKLSGVEREAQIGKTWRQVWPTVDRRIFATYQKVDKTGRAARFVNESRLTNHVYAVLISKVGKGEFVVIFSDITEQRRAEEALRQSEADLAEAQRVAKIGNWTFDIAGNRVRWSRELYRVFGCKERKDGGPYRFFLQCVHPDDRALVLRTNKAARTEGAPFDIEYRIVTPDGAVKTIREVGYAKKDAAGKVIGLFGTAQDISEHKRLEDRLTKVNEELEAKVKERTARLRSLAAQLTQAEHRERRRIAHLLHEDLQQRLVGTRYSAQALKHAVQVDSALHTVNQLVDDLTEAIALTRDLTTRLSPPVLYNLGFSAALDTLAADMKNQSLSVRIAGPRDFRLPSFEMEAFAFDAVRELLYNVAKHSGVKSAEIRIRPAGEKRVTVEVRDKGKGMARPNEPAGTFGLFGIHERSQAMGIGFRINSRPGKGTHAMLTLPIL